MKKFIFAITLFLLSMGNSFAQHAKDTIVFRQGEMKLLFLTDNTYQFFVEPCDICPQLFPNNLKSFGQYYAYKDETYYLYSDTSLYTQQKCNIIESHEDNDNLTFRFHLPRPNNKEHLMRNWLVFNVTLYLMPDSLEWKTLCNTHVANDNNIKAFYTADTLLVIPKPTKPVWYYKVKVFSNSESANIPQFSLPDDNRISSNNNIFDIYMPTVTPEFFLYERFYGEPVTIIDKDAVLFHNRVLLREGAFKPVQYTDYGPMPEKYWKYEKGWMDALRWHIEITTTDEEE